MTPVPPFEAKEMYQNQVKRWRNAWVATFVAFCVTLIFFLMIRADLGRAARQRDGEIAQLTTAVSILEGATGPEAQEQQGRVIENLIITIDCNNREAIQELIDQLDAQLNLVGEIQVVTPECEGEP